MLNLARNPLVIISNPCTKGGDSMNPSPSDHSSTNSSNGQQNRSPGLDQEVDVKPLEGGENVFGTRGKHVFL